MKIGVIADTHDNKEAIRRAVSFFNGQGLELAVHAGDMVAPFSLKAFAPLNVPLHGVFGNCDGEKLTLAKTARELGFFITGAPYRFELGGKNILVMHQPFELTSLVKSQCYDLIIYGHLHAPECRREGRTLILNPGEGGGWLTKKCTVGVIDLEATAGKIIEI